MNKTQKLRDLEVRLDKIYDKLTNDDFIEGKRLSGEIGFYIFDYLPEAEKLVQEQIEIITNRLDKYNKYNYVHINLFDILIEMLKAEEILEDAFEMQKQEGNEALKDALEGTLSQEYVAKFIENKYDFSDKKFVIITGIGSCWPLIRGHNILNALHAPLSKIPVLMFYPGVYTGLDLHPFGVIESSNYYRAFEFIPHEKKNRKGRST
jgi:hypothetical protein